MALFGEKYGDEVRVLSMGLADEASYSTELCGGTHVEALGDIGLFKIVGESAVAGGIRRIEALTGEAARLYLTDRETALKAAAAALKAQPADVPARVTALIEDRRRLERELADAKRALALGGGAAKTDGPASETVAGMGFVGQVIAGLDAKNLRGLVDDAKKQLGSGVAVLVAVNDGRASVAVGVTDDLTARASAVDLVRLAAAAVRRAGRRRPARHGPGRRARWCARGGCGGGGARRAGGVAGGGVSELQAAAVPRRRRRAKAPVRPKPAIIVAHVPGSGITPKMPNASGPSPPTRKARSR